MTLALGTLLLAAAGLYLALLNKTSFALGGGEVRFGQAFAALALTAGLWSVLTLLVVIGGISGEMPRWGACAAIFFIPLSGIAAFVAIDMCARRIRWAILVPALTPPLILLYAVWASLPPLHGALQPGLTSLAVWGSVLALSAAALLLA